VAKVRAPLFSLEARNQLGKQIVFFPWKGVNAVRSYAVPANPRTAAQTAQRNRLAVTLEAIQLLRVHPSQALLEADYSAYRNLASVYAKPMTWMNAICKSCVDSQVAGHLPLISHHEIMGAPAAGTLNPALCLWGSDVKAVDCYYGRTPSALISHKTMSVLTPMTTWAANTDKELGELVIPTEANKTGFVYECTTAGKTGADEPLWPEAYGLTVEDGTAVWTAVFKGFTKFNVSITGLARGKVYYWQVRPATTEPSVGAQLGIYSYLIP
jgi:hypothetical protein